MSQQQPVEMILLRQLASYLTLPIWITDELGNLLYYNEPAEGLLGIEFNDAGPIHAGQLATLFSTTDLDGKPLGADDLAVVRALTARRPAHSKIRLQGMDSIWHTVEISALPIEGQGARFLGVFATFSETAP